MRSGGQVLKLIAARRSVTLRVDSIRQVIAARGIVPVPLTRPQVAGVVTLQGRAIPIYSLEEMDLPGSVQEERPGGPQGARGAWEIVIIEQEGALAGFLVERTETGRAAGDESGHVLEASELLAVAGVIESQPGGGLPARAAHGDR